MLEELLSRTMGRIEAAKAPVENDVAKELRSAQKEPGQHFGKSHNLPDIYAALVNRVTGGKNES